MRKRIVLSALSVLAVIAVTGCGSSSSGSADVTVLSKAEAKKSLIGLDELGKGFRVSKDDEDDDSSMGCLDNFDGVDKVVKEPATEAEVDYEADSDIGLPGVFTAVASFKSLAQAEKGMAAVRKALKDCTAVDETDKDGAHFKLKISTDDDKAGPRADDEVNLNATGTIQTEGIEAPMAVHFALIRVDNHVIMNGIATVAEDARDEAKEIAEVSLSRFVAVLDGKPVPDQTLHLDKVDVSDILGGGAA